ncbi:hypothetical protein [Sulfobacillus sp. hq2]|uniref:hypothetical protein n=1 Tax=Sulfobacillus sp. hq2 TaxID=2039167 RepID=UPI000CD1A9F1|nr:hypothetical protein [Sulfobacillus sp. hq2]POB09472.1 hypothetical protein CO251_14655 [Sulfobacillus sp. hq2]
MRKELEQSFFQKLGGHPVFKKIRRRYNSLPATALYLWCRTTRSKSKDGDPEPTWDRRWVKDASSQLLVHKMAEIHAMPTRQEIPEHWVSSIFVIDGGKAFRLQYYCICRTKQKHQLLTLRFGPKGLMERGFCIWAE